MNGPVLLTALREVGLELSKSRPDGVLRVFIVGGASGMISGELRNSRTTGDCDVMWWGDEADWDLIKQAALVTGRRLGLADDWFNRDCSIYAWSMPLGWVDRCERTAVFGALELFCLSRVDLIAAKVFSSPRRPHDLEDLRDLAPTCAELNFVEAHLDRLSAEHLDGDTFEDQRLVLRVIRKGLT